MLVSMTGYGAGKYDGSSLHVRVEVRGVNHRFLEPVIRLPKGYLSLEDRVRQFLQSRLHRGRVEVFIEIEDTALRQRRVTLDTTLLQSYKAVLGEAAQLLSLEETMDAATLFTLPDVVHVADDDVDADMIWEGLTVALGQAIDALTAMRAAEGQRLYDDLEQHVSTFTADIETIRQRAPHVVKAYEARLMEKINGWQTDQIVEPDRIRAEIALLAERCDITEEITRLNSHIRGFLNACVEESPVGRKLDFLAQEMLREVNTIGSKAADAAVAERVVAAKTTLDRIREQVQNIE